MPKKYPISFVIPLYRSEKTIAHVISEIDQVDAFDWEAILVNDNSPDGVDLVIRGLIKKYPDKIIYLQLSKNGGQQAAIISGLNYTTKEYVATIDDDGQNPPIELIKMIEKLNKDNLDIVFGELMGKQHSLFRNLASNINKIITKYTIGNKNKIPISNVRLMRDYIAKSMAQTSSQYNYIEGLAFLLTDRIESTPIEHKERLVGETSYSLFKLLKLFSNHLIGYSNIVLKLISIFSLIISVVAFIFGVVYFFLTIHNTNRPTGWLSTYLTIAILFSLLFLILSILTEYISRIYSKINQANVKIIRKIHP